MSATRFARFIQPWRTTRLRVDSLNPLLDDPYVEIDICDRGVPACTSSQHLPSSNTQAANIGIGAAFGGNRYTFVLLGGIMSWRCQRWNAKLARYLHADVLYLNPCKASKRESHRYNAYPLHIAWRTCCDTRLALSDQVLRLDHKRAFSISTSASLGCCLK